MHQQPSRPPVPCLHGGAFFEAIGVEFDALERRRQIINADVLDAWFPPAPEVVGVLREHLDWILRTSPPTHCEGFLAAVARARGISSECLVPGAGSSDLIFGALRDWLSPASRVLLLDPTYGEYPFLLEQVIGCRVERFPLERRDAYRVDVARLRDWLRRDYDLVALVNPNSPTGQLIGRDVLEESLEDAPGRTRFWIDETYIDFAGAEQSLERFAARSENVVVCKSMSKAYALSGVRVAYLCAAPRIAAELRAARRPWAIGLPGQIAAVVALDHPDYYAARYQETALLRRGLAERLRSLGLEAIDGVANFVLGHLAEDGPDAATLCNRCRRRGLFLRDAGGVSDRLGRHALRVAVKDADTNERIVWILGGVLGMDR
ncbi:MAG: pyridoxal phosphate-dependent aminotransferase [Planctomycetaceae bacterium]